MAGTLTISTLSDGTNSTSSTNCIQGSAKAWCRFNGSTAAIAASYNVSSITRSSTGTYLVNFTNALSDANYTAVASCGSGATNNYNISSNYATAPTTTRVSLGSCNGNASSMVDAAYTSVAVFR